MPKIPTFTSQVAPTAEVGAVKSNIQISPKSSLAGALLPAANAITKFYVKEKEISNKVEGGELIANANQELLELKEQSKLKSTPEQGVNFFNQGYKQVVDKYKSQANNNYIQKYFQLNISSNKPSYVNNILKVTRANMVKSRVSQVNSLVENKIMNAVESDNEFDLSTLAESVFNDYQGLVSDGLISEEDLQIYKDKLPNLVEVAQVRKIARKNADKAFALLLQTKNFTTIQGDERRKLRTEFATLAKHQREFLSSSLNAQHNDLTSKVMDMYGDKKQYGFSQPELEQFKTGNEEVDNQIDNLNQKIVNKQFSADTNYNINTDVINKIESEEIKDTTKKFLLAGETEPKSILERAGDKTINDKDVNFLTLMLKRNNNKEYNSKASELRQTLHARYLKGLFEGFQPNDLLSYTSENYIAKDIKNDLPKTSDLGSIIINMAKENNITDAIPKLEGETPQEYLDRISKGIDVKDASP